MSQAEFTRRAYVVVGTFAFARMVNEGYLLLADNTPSVLRLAHIITLMIATLTLEYCVFVGKKLYSQALMYDFVNQST